MLSKTILYEVKEKVKIEKCLEIEVSNNTVTFSLKPISKIEHAYLILNCFFYPNIIKIIRDKYGLYNLINEIHKKYEDQGLISIKEQNNNIVVNFSKQLIIDRLYSSIDELTKLMKALYSYNTHLEFESNRYAIIFAGSFLSFTLGDIIILTVFTRTYRGFDITYYKIKEHKYTSLYISEKGEIINYRGEKKIAEYLADIITKGFSVSEIPEELADIRNIIISNNNTITFLTYFVLMFNDFINLISSKPEKYIEIIKVIV